LPPTFCCPVPEFSTLYILNLQAVLEKDLSQAELHQILSMDGAVLRES
jgi:hypothetical protein